jgi:alpha-tubulin suppressor-like RCC1 family protein
MGDNSVGQLGINEPYLENKVSPVLVEALLPFKTRSVSCGNEHTVVCTQNSVAFAWGNNDRGQCGTT